MARKPRQGSSAGVYHFMTRGVNKKDLFHSQRDYENYLAIVKEGSKKLGVQIFHYCLMTNHAHILLHAEELAVLSKFAHCIQRNYALYYCRTHQWPEQVFRRSFASLPINDDAYLLECGRYIERNPVEAKLVTEPEKYPYTSYAFYAFGKKDPLLTESPLYETLGNSERERMAAYRFYVSHERRLHSEGNITL